MAFDGLDKRAFFATDVAARADKNFQIVVEVTAENFLPEKPGAITAANLFAEHFFLKMVFLADIKKAALPAGDQACYEHGLDEEMREIGRDEGVLYRDGRAFVRVANHISHRARL